MSNKVKKVEKTTKKYIALKGNWQDDMYLNKFKTTQADALKAVSTGSNFVNGDSVVLYEVVLKPIKKGKVVYELK